MSQAATTVKVTKLVEPPLFVATILIISVYSAFGINVRVGCLMPETVTSERLILCVLVQSAEPSDVLRE